MKRLNPWQAALVVAAAMVIPSVAAAQRRKPHIGYVYPAGARQGTSAEVSIGGQYLTGVTGGTVSGDGVTVKLVKHVKPLTNKQMNDLRNKIRELQKKAQAARKRNARGRPVINAVAFNAYAKSVGLEDMTLKAFIELRRIAADPKRQPNAQISETAIFEVAVAADAKPGTRQLRLLTSTGVTVPLAFQVGQCREYREVEPNNQAADDGVGAALPVVINGQIMPGDVDRFRFTARKGMRLVAATSARELIPYLADAVPGWFQATLKLLDAQGKEVAYSDDFRFHPDPVIFCRIPADGEYVLEIKDSIFRGREDFVYRITLGEVPFVTGLFPLGGKAGDKTTVALTGWNLPTSTVILGGKATGPGLLPVSVSKAGRASNETPFALDTLPECLEAEPNDDPRNAHAIQLPQIVNGRIGRAGDRDVFRFTGKGGDEIVAEIHARRLASPVDSLLTLTDAAGKQLAVNDDHQDKGAGLTTHQADSRLSIKLPADGAYLLYLSDTQDKGGPEYAYRLRISPRRPDFALRVVPSSFTARSGACMPVTVHAMRRDGFDGEIVLSLIDPPEGFVLAGGGIPAGKDKARLTLTAPMTPTEQPHRLRMAGTAMVAGRRIVRQVVPAEDRMQAFLYRHLVPSDDWMAVVTGPVRRWAPKFSLTKPGRVEVPLGGTVAVRLNGPRARGGQNFKFELADPPAGVTVKSVRPETSGLTITLAASGKELKPGSQDNLIVNVYTSWGGKTKDGKARPRRRVLFGTLPAIPIQIVAKP